MATITVEIPKSIENRVIDGFCTFHGYEETIWAENAIDRIPNPETKLQFMQKKVSEIVINGVRATEVNAASRSAKKAVEADLESKVTVVLIPKSGK